eukprot:NODE_1561_length_1373_cov_4.234139_g1297_i0.p2 GENE.NODE_1561_length_1373_cov_4.234139_g1297_i0~~NODE_1561_length_1373_cov_4.234139_g1297_i0.p2  ORF type:complete len:109 (-),score=6.03 NODE_1561_length_1373_cov_4.234139_g1297_i0:510-836(-)
MECAMANQEEPNALDPSQGTSSLEAPEGTCRSDVHKSSRRHVACAAFYEWDRVIGLPAVTGKVVPQGTPTESPHEKIPPFGRKEKISEKDLEKEAKNEKLAKVGPLDR